MVSSEVEYRLSSSESAVGENKLVTSNLLSVICPLSHHPTMHKKSLIDRAKKIPSSNSERVKGKM